MSRWTGAGPLSPKARSPGHSYILQPIAQFIAQPYGGNPTGLRIEDCQAFEFDDNNVFSFNQVPGYDLIESGPRANVGAMAEALFPGGKVEAQVGQTYRLKPDPLFAAFSGNSGTSSDLVGSFSVKFPHLDITDRWTWTAATARCGGMKFMSPAAMTAPRCRSAM